MKKDDIEKVKLDILRDALKDAIDTIRALDRKIVFLVSYSTLFLGAISTMFLKYEKIKGLIEHYQYFYLLLAVIFVIWIIVFIRIMTSIAPQANPIDVFKDKNDKSFSNNTFFVYTGGQKHNLVLNDLIDQYSKIDSYTKIEKLLYKEIGKVSYIRDLKSNKISSATNWSWGLTLLLIILIVSFSSVSFL